MKAILTYLPFLKEAWSTSGKKSYTWKSNRSSAVLIAIIALLLYVGYVGHSKYQEKITSLKKEVETLKIAKDEYVLANKKGEMDVRHLTSSNLECKATLKRQDDIVVNLRSALVNKESELKTTQLEKQNVEKLLVASANQTMMLKEKIAAVGNHSRNIEESKSHIRKKILSLYGSLNQK